MKKKTKHLQKRDVPKGAAKEMILERLTKMRVISKYDYLKFLFEPKTGCYFVYNNYTTASYFSRSFNTASSLFDRYIDLLN